MKKILWIMILAAWMPGAVPAGAAEPAAMPGAVEAIDKNRLEGWIVRIEYTKGYFRLLDPRGFERRVVTKPGEIGDYRIGDKVRVEIDPDRKFAQRIEKIY